MCNSNKETTLKGLVKRMEKEIEKALPNFIDKDRFIRIAITSLSANPKLNECTKESFLLALMHCAQLGLEPNTPLGHAYIIPYKNNKKGTVEAEFQIGYKGLIELAYRSDLFLNIYSKEIYENDVFEYEYGLNPKLIHKPTFKNRGEIIGYYALFKLKNGGFHFEIITSQEAVEFAKENNNTYSKGYGIWNNEFHEMAKKTVIKRVLKYAPIKVEVTNNQGNTEAVFYETIKPEPITFEIEEKKEDKKEE
jgi:recombination protein RecT